MADLHVWASTLLVLVGVIAFDFFLAARRPREVGMREASLWVVFYILSAVVFAVGLYCIESPKSSGEFVAGWLTEYSLSIDNLFVFLIIFSRLKVPKKSIQSVLMIGIALALVFRGLFITLGAVLIHRFIWMFFIFGTFLIVTAVRLIYQGGGDEDWQEGRVVSYFKRQRVGTFGVAVVAIGTTDLLFAFDSIPAIFGITQDPYIVFTANAFALMGLRQLYVLLGRLVEQLVHLSKGLAVILAFIGIKLIGEALDGVGVDVPQISVGVTLAVIVLTLAITTVVSLNSDRKLKN
ncbi:MAG TPA: TerC family protein [Candidatus Nanopelagicaceae bacterium]|nr:TerC family protein [Candidatus Nanopelagicaceae bacterium]